MNRNIIILATLAGLVGCGSPSFARVTHGGHGSSSGVHNPTHAYPVAAITEITLSEDDGGGGGRNQGGSRTWTLRPDGTVQRMIVPSQRETDFGDYLITGAASGTYSKDDFARLARYLQTAGFSGLKPPAMQNDEAVVRVSVRRGAHTHSVAIPASAPERSAAATLSWGTRILVRGMMAEVDWKNAAGRAIDTGLKGHFSLAALPTTAPQPALGNPQVAVRNERGQQVGVIQPMDQFADFRLMLPPGTYQLAPKNPRPDGYVWHPQPATVLVEAGSYTPIVITLEKISAAP